jgi:hypothetical protein
MSMTPGYETVEGQSAKPAKVRFSDPIALRSVYDKLTDEDAVEATRRVKIRNLYDGNLPYSPDQLRASGLKNLTNVNFLGMKGVIDSRADTLLRLTTDTANLIELQPLSRELAGPDAAKIATVVAEEFSRTLRETGKVIPALSMMHTEADLYGLGPVTWTSSIDYNPVALERGQLRFVGNGPVVSSSHDLFMFETTVPASYMFYLLDNEKIAEAEGWNIPAVKKWLVDAFANSVSSAAQPGAEGGTSVMEHQLALYRQNRFQEEHQFDELHVIHTFVREMTSPRSITHIIMPATELKEFLFVKPDAYRTMDECLLWFPYSVNCRYARSVRGLASFLYPIETLNNRFTCQMVDVAFRASTFVLSQKTSGSHQDLTINEQGPYTFIPQEFTPTQSQVAPNFQQLAQVKQMLDQVGVSSVTGGDAGPVGTTGVRMFEGSSKQSKAEVELQARQRTHKEEALFVQKIAVLDKVFRETFRRFIRLVVSENPVLQADYPEIAVFIDRCARRGVSVEMLAQTPVLFTVATCRDLILGSEGKVGVLSEILGAFAGNMDEAGRRNATRDIVQLRLGQTSADRYTPESSRDSQPTDAASLATLENNMMRQGQETLVGQDQLHWSHIPVHAQLLQEIVQMVGARPDNEPSEAEVENIANPQGTLDMLVRCSQHVQQHLAIGGMQIGMQAETKRVQAMLRDLRPTIKALNLAVATQERVEQARQEKAQREQEELQRQADENEFRKAAYKADRQAEIDKYKADLAHQVELHRLGLSSEESAKRSATADRESQAAEMRRDRESDARIDAMRQQIQAKENAASAVARYEALQQAIGAPRTSPGDIAYDDEVEQITSL